MNTRFNRSTGKAPKNVTNKDLLSIFYRNQLNNIGDHALKLVKMFEYQKKIFHSEKVINLSSRNEIFKIVKVPTFKPPTYNLCGEQSYEILGKLCEQELSKCII